MKWKCAVKIISNHESAWYFLARCLQFEVDTRDLNFYSDLTKKKKKSKKMRGEEWC